MGSGFVIKEVLVDLPGRQHGDAARTLGSEFPTNFAMALQQQGAIGREQLPELVAAADAALYVSKEAGRNRVSGASSATRKTTA